MSRVHMENHELREMGPDTKGSRTHLDDISQREYEDRAQLIRLGKKPALKVSCCKWTHQFKQGEKKRRKKKRTLIANMQ